VSRTSFLPEHQVTTPLFEVDPLFKAGTHLSLLVCREKAR
jgi:hypothetical protein